MVTIIGKISLIASFHTISAAAQDTLVQSLTNQQLVESGRDVFVHNCSGCHGMDAQGTGAAAKMLEPRPRNLVSGAFKFRSTPMGSMPTAEDIMRTIDQGVLGTAMPAFPLMPSTQKFALVQYLRSLRPDWKTLEGSPIRIPEPPSDRFAAKSFLFSSAARGKETFQAACLTCHGAQGIGDGPAAASLTDSDNRPIRPANLTRPFIKSGRTAQDVFKAISTGLDGTPMPSFADVFTEDQRWDLVAYVFFLRGRGAGIYPAEAEPAAQAAPVAPAARKGWK